MLTRGLERGAQCRYQEATELLSKGVRLMEKQHRPNVGQLRNAYNALGILKFTRGSLPKAQTMLDHALRVSSDTGEESHIGGLLNDSAVILMKQGDFEQAHKHLTRAKGLVPSSSNSLLLSIVTQINLAEWHFQQDDRSSAMVLLRQAKSCLSKLDRNDPNFIPSSAVVHGSLGRVCLLQNSLTEARECLEHAAKMSSGMDHRHPSHAKCVSNLALFHLYQHNSATAFKLLRRARSGFRKAVGTRHVDMAICLNNLAAVSTFSNAATLYSRSHQILHNANNCRQSKQCLLAVQMNQTILEHVEQHTHALSFPPENLLEALQMDRPERAKKKLQLLFHGNHIMGVGMP